MNFSGARQLKERLSEAVFVFVLPPSMETLEQRLSDRGSDAEEAERKRIDRAAEEVREATRYDYVIVNEDLDRAVADLHSIIDAARLARDRVLPGLRDRFDFG